MYLKIELDTRNCNILSLFYLGKLEFFKFSIAFMIRKFRQSGEIKLIRGMTLMVLESREILNF